ncbi:DUF2779 domain-containing protein [Rhodohalobacter sulfatireducens]|uniref:DUF2779 domain-containing protein n=1 Tax=Rhodohalobacter sulfatireducens TaxID=2911366 RepID=A0ABS9KAA8_9BACT|nr:DUF2779 domain-containing protein [Rhodohalobacter sulfatireducens]MCG2587788.1 DUF2779 domain-containing protein [Rhodohalobacter sulfatireducens]
MHTFLTKSKFTHCLECPTKLYYKNHEDEYVTSQDDNDFLQALADGGIQVGELAKLYYPGGTEIEYSRDKSISLDQTTELLKLDEIIIYEAAIRYGLTYALVDILVKKGDRIDLIEVKSKSWDEEKGFYKRNGDIYPDWHKYLYDVAFQTWVMQKAYPDYNICPHLMLIDKGVPTSVEGLHQYFKIIENEEGRSEVRLTENRSDIQLGDPIMTTIDVSDEVALIFNDEARKPESELEARGFDGWIDGLCELISRDEKYPVSIGAKCRNCEHRVNTDKLNGKKAGFNECWKEALNWSDKELAKPHVFDVWYANSKKYMDDEIYLMEEISPEYIGTDEKTLYKQPIWNDGRKQRQLAQVMKMTGRHDDSEVILPGLFHEMDSWTYPLHFIDFEGISPAIPFHKGCYPYKKIPFQFSMHNVYRDGRVEHAAEWVDKRKGVYPGFDFVRELKKVLEQDEGSVFMYYHYEKTTLNDVKSRLLESEEPDKEELITWIDTLVFEGAPRYLIDQQRLVVKYYYSVHMGGSNSIKDVLPAVLNESEALKQIYTKPYSGLSLKNKVLYETDENGMAINPYKLLDPVGYGIPDESEDVEIELESGDRITEGGTAMMVWARMQFDDVSDEEREDVFEALLRYCELDTLAMVMIYQHWDSLNNETRLTDKERLINYCIENDRVCPMPKKWNELFKVLPNKKREGLKNIPSMPLILAAWHNSSNLEKTERLKEHIEWADRHGKLETVAKFIFSIKEDEWYCSDS